jgi:non-ribosomal peptide synthetase component F
LFLEYADFIRSLVLVRPAVGMVCWRKEADLLQTIVGLREVVIRAADDAQLATINAESHDGDWFRAQLMERIQATDADRTWLFISRIEEVLPTAARVLNGARGQLGRFRGVVVFVRENRRGEFQQLCPDLMDWVGLRICLAHHLSPRRGLSDIAESLNRLEAQYDLASSSFLADPSVVRSASPHDAWLWNELLTIQSELSAAEESRQ